jgi:iron-sulfur cluster repair protein YtfE (RIC family)
MEYFDFMRAIYSIGNNLNQLVHLAHRFGSIHADMLEDFKKQYRELILTITQRMITPDDLDIPTTLERGRQLAEAEQGKEGEHCAD